MSLLITITTTLPKAVADRLAELSSKLRVPRSSLIRDILTVESIEAWASQDPRLQRLNAESVPEPEPEPELAPELDTKPEPEPDWLRNFGANSTRLLSANEDTDEGVA